MSRLDGTGTRVLLISDDHDMATVFADFLEMEGFETCVADNSQFGLSEALSGTFSVALIDAMHPPMEGLEILRAVRNSSELPILMLMDGDDEIDRIICLEMGADDSVAKPCTSRELLARIRAILRRTQDRKRLGEGRAITIGAMTLWPQRRTVAIDGATLHLTGTEFTLLELLTQHVGAIVSKQVLAQAALGRPLLPNDRSIDVHISSIRQKLGNREGGLPWIQTIRGKGYQFILG